MSHSNWRTDSFDPKKAIARIDAFDDSQGKADAIMATLEAYREARDKWRQVLAKHPDGLVRERVEEYAEVLHCEPQMEKVTVATYNLVQRWPSHAVPILETRLQFLNLRVEAEGLLERVISFERQSELIFVNVETVRGPLNDHDSIEGKLTYLRNAKKSIYQNADAGTLGLIDPDTGDPVIPEDGEAFQQKVQEFVTTYIDAELFALKNTDYQSSIHTGAEARNNPHVVGRLVWSGSVEKLVALMEDLRSQRLIDCDREQIPSIIAGHFVDFRERQYSLIELGKHSSRAVPEGAEKDSSPIMWRGTAPQLIVLIISLAKQWIISIPEGAGYTAVIVSHFVKSDTSAYDRSVLSSAKDRTYRGKQDDPYATNDKVKLIQRIVGAVKQS